MAEHQKYDKSRADRGYWLAFSATLVFFGGFYALLIPLPRYLAQAGLPDWQIGLVLGAFGVAALVGRPLAGWAADRYGPARVMLAGAALLAIGALGVETAQTIGPLFGLRLVQSAGYVAFTTAGTALVVALSPAAVRLRRLAVFGAAANVAIALAPTLVSALLRLAPLSWALRLAALLALLAAGLTVLIGPAAQPVPNPSAQPAAGWSRPALRLLLPTIGAAALLGAGFGAFFQFAPLLAERRGVDAGLLYGVYGAAIIATRLTAGRWLERTSLARTLLIGNGSLLAGLLLAGLGTGWPLLTLAVALIAAGSGVVHPLLIAQSVRLWPDAPGRATAGFYLGFDCGIGAGTWLCGLALQVGGLTGLFLTAAALVACGIGLIPRLAGR